MVVFEPLSRKRLELDHNEKLERDNQSKNLPQHESRLLEKKRTNTVTPIWLRSVDAEANEENQMCIHS